MNNELSIAVVCSSNQNRSMEAHYVLSKKGFKVQSFGTGSAVKLPGTGPSQPNVYSFETTYEHMYQDLQQKDAQLYSCEESTPPYTQNGLLYLLDRNRRIKPRPERFQATRLHFDVIFTVEERIYDCVLADIESQGSSTYTPVHVINLEVKDNHEDATLGAFLILEICQLMSEAKDLENEIEDIVQLFEAKNSRTLLHSVAFY